jgi:hypothetical protein
MQVQHTRSHLCGQLNSIGQNLRRIPQKPLCCLSWQHRCVVVTAQLQPTSPAVRPEPPAEQIIRAVHVVREKNLRVVVSNPRAEGETGKLEHV